MLQSVKVADYYDNDDNVIWSWYLANIRNGSFEEILNNPLKFTLLKRFLNAKFVSSKNEKILFVSISDSLYHGLKILEDFLKDYFKLDDLDNITIQKLNNDDGKDTARIYNHENHYLLIHRLNNFNNSFLLHHLNNIPKDHETTTVTQTKVEDFFNDSESNISMEINFKPKFNKNTHSVEQEHQPRVDTPPFSGTESIHSYGRESDDEYSESALNYLGHPLTLTNGRHLVDDQGSFIEAASIKDSVSALSGISRSDVNSGSNTSLDTEDYLSDNLSFNSEYSLLSVLPYISIDDSLGHFRLVLQSILIQDPTTKEIYTAIRQSNSQPHIATTSDDWLLYDSQFSMDNLEIVSLQSLLDSNKNSPKFLFYSMLMVTEEDAEIKDSTTDSVCKGTSLELRRPGETNDIRNLGSNEGIDQNILAATYLVPESEDDLSVSDVPQTFLISQNVNDYDIIDNLCDSEFDSDPSLPRQFYPEMYTPTKVQTNTTIAHRSIRTINSACVYYNDESDVVNKTYNGSVKKSNSEEEELLKIITLTPSNYDNTGLTKYVTGITNMSAVERSESMSLPELLKQLSSVNDGKGNNKVGSIKRIKQHMHKKSSQNGKKSKKHSNGTICTIM